MNALTKQIFDHFRMEEAVSADEIEKAISDLREIVTNQYPGRYYEGYDLFLLLFTLDIYSKTVDALEEEAIKAATASGSIRFTTKLTQAENKELTEELERFKIGYGAAMLAAETMTHVSAVLLDLFNKQEMDPATQYRVSNLRDQYYPRIVPRSRMNMPGVYDLVSDTHTLGTYNTEEEAKEALAKLLEGPPVPF